MDVVPAVSGAAGTAGATAMAAGAVPEVLSYATGRTMPTRVRFNTAELAGRWAFWIAFVGIVALNVEFCIFVGWMVTECFRDGSEALMALFGLRWLYGLEWYYWGGRPTAFAEAFRDCANVLWPYVAGGLVFLADGMVLRWMAGLVRGGSKAAAGLAILLLGVIAVIVLGLTTWGLVGAIYFSMVAGGVSWWLLLLLPVGVGMLILTLMAGAFRQLAWVARNPDLERPPLRFWPRRRRALYDG